jgi:hypothetical protein
MVVIDELGRIAEAIPDYDIERELGRGGMGVVFLGRHRRLERGVAIKELPPSFAAEAEVRERFSTEARTLATLSHPHIVPIFDYVERDGLCLIVMEQLSGGTVWDRFTTVGLTPPAACATVMACCAALDHAHTRGVLHLDVKPDNLMFGEETTVKVTDFGIARVISGGRTLGTVDGQVLGTPAYMAPEQARGDDLTPAADVYAAGVMLYELLSGQLPWLGAQTAAELLHQRLEEDPIHLREQAPHVPGPIAEVVMRAIEREIEDRFERAEDLGIAIGEACAESWGIEWLDHTEVALVGSDRLSRAARTTSERRPAAAPVPVPPTSATSAASGGIPGAAATGATTAGQAGPARAAETGVVGRVDPGAPPAPETVAGPSPAAPDQARETTARDATPPEAPEQARETTARDAAPPTGPSQAHVTGASAPAGPAPARETVARGAPPEPQPAPATVGPGGPGGPAGEDEAGPGPEAFEVVKAASAESRIEGADLYLLEMADLVGVEDVLDPPKPPWPALAATGALAAIAVLVALLGPGSPERGGDLRPGQVELAGVDVAGGSRIPLDLAEPVPVRITDRSLAASADAVDVELSYLGIPVSTLTAAVRGGEGLLDPDVAERTVAGKATATVRVSAGPNTLAEHRVGARASQTWYLTLPFAAAVLLLLLAYANLETSLKPLRSGHPRALSSIGAAVSGAIAGVGLVLLFGALGVTEPTVAGAVITAVVGGVTGAVAARARVGVARRRRVKKALKRAERALGVKAPPVGGRAG